jgi:hypothetical protein
MQSAYAECLCRVPAYAECLPMQSAMPRQHHTPSDPLLASRREVTRTHFWQEEEERLHGPTSGKKKKRGYTDPLLVLILPDAFIGQCKGHDASPVRK